VACVFVSHVDGKSRHDDFTCNERYARFIVEDLISWVQNCNAGIATNECLIGGVSLSGLQAAYTALLRQEIFSFTLCQSGSLWWNDEWLTGFVKNCTTTGNQFWVSVGDQETESGVSHPPTNLVQDVDQISAVNRFVAALNLNEKCAHSHLFHGGHETRCWEAEFSDAIKWLLG